MGQGGAQEDNSFSHQEPRSKNQDPRTKIQKKKTKGGK